jgi:hypothetical protein
MMWIGAAEPSDYGFYHPEARSFSASQTPFYSFFMATTAFSVGPKFR